MAQVMSGGRTRRERRTPAQWYCLLAGAALVLAGVLGWIADATFGSGADVDGSNLLLFEVNGWHNLVHLLSGLVLVAAAARATSAKTIALLFGLTYGAVAVWGLLDDTVLGLLPVNAADNVLHLALSAVGILAAIASPGDQPLHTTTAPATRQTPVEDRAGRLRSDDPDPLTGAPRDREAPTR
jgi:Domain of unknown function (DUF4383)